MPTAHTLSQGLRGACVALAVAIATVSCNATPKSPPGTGVVLNKEGKPMAGVHVLVWRKYLEPTPWWSIGLGGVSSSSSGRTAKCKGQHYQLTDEHGRFAIPAEIIDHPGSNIRNTHLDMVAFKPGFWAGGFKANIKRTTAEGLVSPDEYAMDYFPKADKPLHVQMLMVPYPAVLAQPKEGEVAADWRDLIYAACTCTPYHEAVNKEVETRDATNESIKRERAGNVRQAQQVNFCARADGPCAAKVEATCK